MALFRFQALTPEGKRLSGTIDADSYAQAKEKLGRQRALVTQLTPLDQRDLCGALPPALLLGFTRDLSQLLQSGLPLYESLLSIEEKYRRHRAHPLFLELCDQIKNGSSLSCALKKFPKSFNDVYLAMVSAAERSGSLTCVFDQLTQLIGRQQKLRKQILSALTYPAFLGAFCLLVVFSLLFFVVPSMEELFEGRTLHPLTACVLALSRFARAHGYTLLCGALACAASLWSALRSPRGKRWVSRLSLTLPLAHTLFVQAALVRFCRCLAVLLSSGVPLLEALSLARRVMHQPLLEDVIRRAEKMVAEGTSLTSALQTAPLIPPLMIRMLLTAEATGQTVSMLQHVAEIYEEALEKQCLQLTALLQPALLLLLGGIVGVVLLSILIPLTDAGSLM